MFFHLPVVWHEAVRGVSLWLVFSLFPHFADNTLWSIGNVVCNSCVQCLHWIDSTSFTLHLLYFWWMFHLWEHSGSCVPMTISGTVCNCVSDKLAWICRHMGEDVVWLIVTVTLKWNRNEASVKYHGTWVNHVIYECNHLTCNWKYALNS